MKMAVKRMVSFVLVLIMVLTLMPQIPMAVAAASAWIEPDIDHILDSTEIRGEDFTSTYADKLNKIFDGEVQLFTKPADAGTFPLGSALDVNQQYNIPSISGYQCYIYAQAVYYYLFGDVIYAGNGKNGSGKAWSDSKKVVSNETSFSYELFARAGVGFGAYIRTTDNTDGSFDGNVGHSMIVLAYDKTSITYLDCNAKGSGRIRVQKRSWENFNKQEIEGKNRRISHIVQCISAMCNHTYKDCGICSECGYVFDWKSTFNPADAGIYKMLNTSYVPRTEPYTDSVQASFCVSNPNSVEVIGSYTNAYGNKWYAIKNSGKEYYIYCERMELVKRDAPKVTCTNFAPANNAEILKATYNLTGTVTSSNYPLQKIVGYIDGSVYATWTASNQTTMTVNLKSTVINTQLKFSSLDIGKHTIKLVAYGYNGTSVTFHTSVFYTVETVCTHSYTSKITTAATCTTAGVRTYTCSKCSGSYTESIAATGHSWKNATCTAAKTCSVCGATSGSALGHSYTYKATKAPTTSATGSLTGTCSKCSGTTTVPLPKLTTTDYTYKVTTAATCTATGTGRYTWKTTTYGSFYFDVSIAKADHSWNSATCTAAKTCSVCGTTSGSALGHSYNSGVVTTAATCTAAGVRTYTCNTCGAKKTETIAATGHSWKDATCTTAKTCSSCGATSGSALGHSYNSGVITTAATCTTAGVKTYTCSACGSKKTESIAANGHSWKSATCTEPETCATCGLTAGTELEHSYKAEITPPTCTEQGYTTHTCAVCGDSYKDGTTDVLGHQYADGSCTRCGAEDPNHVADQNMPQIIVEGTNAKAGETVSVTIALKNNPGITALNLAFRYDSSALTFVSAENMATDMTMTSGTAYVWDCASNYTHSGDLLKLTFQIADNATSGDYSIEVVFLDASNEDFEEVQMLVESGYITVTAAMYGDANGDGKVTTVDLSMLRKYLANIDPSTGESSLSVKLGADVNGDGKVSTVDISMLRKYFANMDPVTGESSLVLGPR